MGHEPTSAADTVLPSPTAAPTTGAANAIDPTRIPAIVRIGWKNSLSILWVVDSDGPERRY